MPTSVSSVKYSNEATGNDMLMSNLDVSSLSFSPSSPSSPSS